MPIDPGRLREVVYIRAPQTAQDEAGQPLPGHTDVCTVRAEVRYLSGMEAIKGGAPVSTVRASMLVRRTAAINHSHVAVLGGTVFNILAVQPADDAGYMYLVCEATQ